MVLNPPKISFSHHSIQRYQERIEKGKVDEDYLYQKLISNFILCTVLKNKGQGKFNTKNCTLVIQDYTVVTIIPLQKKLRKQYISTYQPPTTQLLLKPKKKLTKFQQLYQYFITKIKSFSCYLQNYI